MLLKPLCNGNESGGQRHTWWTFPRLQFCEYVGRGARRRVFVDLQYNTRTFTHWALNVISGSSTGRNPPGLILDGCHHSGRDLTEHSLASETTRVTPCCIAAIFPPPKQILWVWLGSLFNTFHPGHITGCHTVYIPWHIHQLLYSLWLHSNLWCAPKLTNHYAIWIGNHFRWIWYPTQLSATKSNPYNATTWLQTVI